MDMVFEVVDENLNRIGTTTNASELHGMLAGLVCAGVDEDDIDNWLPVLCFEDRFVTEDEYRMFEHDVRGFYREVLKQLDEFGVEFNILLPEERNSSTDRIVAMTSWCTGYLKALIDYGEISVEQLSEECVEFLDDVRQISELDPEQEPTQEEMESSFMILDEHLRVGVQLIDEQLNMHSISTRYKDAGVPM